MTLIELAERCERAEGADREIDLEIARHLGVTVMMRNDEDTANYETTHWHYTASIDDARTLVPERWWLAGLSFCHPDFRSTGDREYHAEIGGPVTWLVIDRELGEEPQFECEGGNAATPALALCAAALRARSQS